MIPCINTFSTLGALFLVGFGGFYLLDVKNINILKVLSILFILWWIISYAIWAIKPEYCNWVAEKFFSDGFEKEDGWPYYSKESGRNFWGRMEV